MAWDLSRLFRKPKRPQTEQICPKPQPTPFVTGCESVLYNFAFAKVLDMGAELFHVTLSLCLSTQAVSKESSIVGGPDNLFHSMFQ